MELIADELGHVTVPRDPFPIRGVTFPGDPPENEVLRQAVLIIRIEYEGKAGYSFLPAYVFNRQYWRGQTELAEYEIRTTLVPN